MMRTHPTPHADINTFLALLLSRMHATLRENLTGLYLYGSLATGDFDRGSSDIDFIAAISSELDESDVARLRAMHEEIGAMGGEWGGRLEGAYISLAALRRYEPAYRQPFLSEDAPFAIARADADWIINRHTLREKGVVLYGPPPATLIDPVSHEELATAVRDQLRGFWTRAIDEPEFLRPRRYQAFAVLTMCRALYALEEGDIVSKPDAARWAKEHLATGWTPLIQCALTWRHDPQIDDAALPETLRFLRYAISLA